MNNQIKLRKILISRFVLTIAVVAVIEALVFLFINRVAFPIVISLIMPHFKNLNELSLGMVILGIILLVVILVLRIASFFFPTMAGLNEALLKAVLKNVSVGGPDTDNVDTSMIVIILLLLVAILVMAIVPYVVGAIAYTTLVSREFRKLDEDITRQRAEDERAKYLMISDIVHDLKTPMTTVTGYAKALNEGMVKGEDQKEYLEAIYNKSGRMNEIVNLLFDYVKLDSEGYSLVKKTTDLTELVREIVALNYTDIEDAGDELDIGIPDGPIDIEADKMQFSRVITNLLVNAVKHNASETKIGVYVRDDYDNLRIYVADSGEMIPEDIAENLFDPFVMGDKSRVSKGGTGLGLSISKKICEMHGFKIKLVQRPEMNRYQLGDQYNKVFVIIMNK
ncbi:MAG: HAMP domain-containing histidine kinase [Clostridiales bacterium]|nr:HAMP domain-containing histidine kinase [Clostridiales bacterium]